MSSSTPRELGQRIFSHQASSLGLIDAGLSSMDNEQVFQILIQIIIAGIETKGLGFGDMLIENVLEDFNQQFLWTQFRLNIEKIPISDSRSKLYYCNIVTNNTLTRNKFHPLHLMNEIPYEKQPQTFRDLLDSRSTLPEIFGVRKYNNYSIAFSFVPARIIH